MLLSLMTSLINHEIYFLRFKEFDEVLSRFKKFKAFVKKLSNKKVKVLRSEGKYTSSIFHKIVLKCWQE